MSKEYFKFVLFKRSKLFLFNPSLMLLLAKVDLILEEQSYKKDTLEFGNTGCIEIALALLTKIIIFHIQAFIV